MNIKSSIELPHNYKPYKILHICSNEFINGSILFELKGQVPLLIGRNDILPLIWLKTPILGSAISFKSLVEENREMYEGIKISSEIASQTIRVYFESEQLLRVRKISDDEAEIVQLDLRSVGLNIYGDHKELNVTSNQFTNNKFENIHTMFLIS